MNDEKLIWLPLLALFLIVITLWGISWYFLTHNDLLVAWDQRGTFGDMFGAVNALFSGLAFAGVIYAIILQRKELMLQRRELEFTRHELEGQKIQLEEQSKTSKLQRFESTFFQLVDLLDSIIEKIDLSGIYIAVGPNRQQQKITGNKALAVAYNALKTKFEEDKESKKTPEDVKITYSKFYEIHHKYFGHFFRNLYHLLKYVEASGIDNKELYFDLVRAKLDENAILLTYYNAYTELGGYGMKEIISEIQFFKNIDKEKFLRPEDVELFPPSAFGTDY